MRLRKNKIIKTLEEEKDFLKKNNVKKIGLFGSFLKGKQNRKSDVDLLIEFEKVSADNFFEVLFTLEKIFRCNVDLVDLRKIRKEMDYVKKEAEYVEL